MRQFIKFKHILPRPTPFSQISSGILPFDPRHEEIDRLLALRRRERNATPVHHVAHIHHPAPPPRPCPPPPPPRLVIVHHVEHHEANGWAVLGAAVIGGIVGALAN